MVPRVPAVVRGGNTIAARKSAQKHQRQVELLAAAEAPLDRRCDEAAHGTEHPNALQV